MKTEFENKLFLTASEVAKITGFKKSRAYGVINEINEKCRLEGIPTLKGRVATNRFLTYFGL